MSEFNTIYYFSQDVQIHDLRTNNHMTPFPKFFNVCQNDYKQLITVANDDNIWIKEYNFRIINHIKDVLYVPKEQ